MNGKDNKLGVGKVYRTFRMGASLISSIMVLGLLYKYDIATSHMLQQNILSIMQVPTACWVGLGIMDLWV